MFSYVEWIASNRETVTYAVTMTLIRISIILAAAWLAHTPLRRRNPRYRILLWRLTAVSVLAVIVVSQNPFA